ncbi:MAG: putative Ig domain-containing protein, partial [Candidatus Zixiibacteriota bacterium]
SAVDSEVVTITINQVNLTPVLAAIGSKSTDEGVNLNFTVSATDADGTTPTITTSALPSGATFTSTGTGTETFDWTPDFTQAGPYTVTFYATDDSSAVDSEVVTITVNQVNLTPVLAAIGSKSTDEGVNLNFTVSATDADGTTPTITTSALPTGATFTSTGTGTETFDWTPDFTQAGPYTVTFYATDDSLAVDSEVVTITVNQVNFTPVLAVIGSKSTDEGVNLNFTVSATDADGTTPNITTSALPTGATFTSTGTGTETFDWTPDFTQAGPYTVTFYATDDSSAVDSEVVTITINQVNLTPVLAAIGSKSTDEGVNLNFTVSATDADGTTPTITTSALPTGATFTSTGTGTETFDWTPDFTQAGPYTVTFYATDDSSAVDSEIVTITVNQVNLTPVLAAIGSKSTDEGVNLNFTVSATDADGTTPTITTSALPTGATFTSTGTGTETFDWTPDFTQASPYTVTFYATDDSSAVDSEVVTITVNQVNLTPVLAAIGSKSTDEGVNLNFTVSATDADGTTPTITTSALPSGATFTSTGSGTETFDWTPDFTQAGPYTVTFYTTDDSSAVDSEVVTITVNQVNQPPVIATIGSQSTAEAVNLSFGVSVTDIDGTIATLTHTSLPAGASFIDNGNNTGSFDWTPTYLQSGIYTVTFYATDDSSSVDSEVVTITVIDAGNRLPVLASIGTQSTTENINLNFTVSATDIESTPTLTTSALPTGATFADNGNGTGTFDWTPTFLQSGPYTVTFYATDDSLAVDSEIVTINIVDAGNQLPVLATIGSKSSPESVNLSFGVSATDIESIPSLTTSSLPDGAGFTDNHDGTGVFSWTPNFTQSGVYIVKFYATDDSLAVDSEAVTIQVFNTNQPPVLAIIGSKSVDEGVNLNFTVSATDPNGTTPVLTSSTLPSGATFTGVGGGTGTFNWTPDFTQAGPYTVTFYATDDSSAVDSEVVSITVNQVNLPPTLAAIGAQSTTENVNLNFGISASDPDGVIPTLSTSTLPAGAGFVDNGNGTGAFDWTPTFLQSGPYTVTFYATDDSSAVDSEVVTITVIDGGNQLPILAAIGPKSADENVNINFTVIATDIESIPGITTSSLPSGATITTTGSGTETFDWTPDYSQSGIYNITFYATDDSLAVDSEVVTFTINQVNLSPVLAAVGNKIVDEGANLNFTVSATDPDGTIPAITTSILPAGASFTSTGSGTETFDWNPTYAQSGSYSVTFYATDDSLVVDSEVITITVNQVNLPPILAAIGARSVTEGLNLSFGISASDPDGFVPVLTTSALPSGASFSDNGDGTGTFGWTPVYNQSGSYSVTFYATDDSLAIDSEVVSITVIEAGNQTPVLAAIGNKFISEGVNLNFNVSATDADSTIPGLTTTSLPSGAAFVDNGDGTGNFSWTPNFTQAGAYSVTFYASDGVAIDSEQIYINVFETGNQAPVWTTIGNKSTTEGVNLNFGVTATDPDATNPVLTTTALPSGAAFVDNHNGTGTFNWTPGFTQSGSYNISFYATDGVYTDTELVTITVVEAGNQTPVLAAIGAQSTMENVNLSFGVSATDADLTIPHLTTSTLPSGASFNDNGNGTGTFGWTPTFLQSGIYYVTFYATDDTSAVDSEIVTITVNEGGNQLPILAAIGNRSTTENVNLNFGISATDIESTPILTTSALPAGAGFVE